jgi:hypothetical protein
MTRLRASAAFLLVLALGSRSAAQPGQLLRLSIEPADAPKPGLKYRLLPDPRELVPGNAAVLYNRALASFYENPALLKDIKEAHWDEWLAAPLANFPKEEVSRGVGMTRHLVAEIEQAALRKECDWQLGNRPEGVALLLPEVQGFRRVGVVLAVHARLAIAERDWDRAVRALRLGYSLGRDIGKGPLLIQMLVGAAIVQVMNKQLDALVQQPGAPNLYWALAVLPRPLFDPKPALLEESDLLARLWPALTQMDRGVLSVEEVQAALAALRARLDEFAVRKPTEAERVAQSALITAAAPGARRWLVQQGLPAARVEAMQAVQVVAVYAYRQHRLTHEEWLKWALTPEGIYTAGYKKASRELREAGEQLDRLFFHGLLRGLEFVGLSDVTRALEVAQRVERRRAAQTCIEALRLHAARNGGRWPATLDAVTEVPVPKDPHTGKPFEYRLEDGRATLATPRHPAEPAKSTLAVHYELLLRPAK